MTLSYQWFQIPSGGATGVAVPGATSSTYVTPAVDTTYNGAQYYATVTDACGPLTSTDATLTVTAGNVPPTIITQPVGADGRCWRYDLLQRRVPPVRLRLPTSGI